MISFILDSSSIIPILSGNIQISWYTWSSLSWAYNAWNINYSALWLDPVKYYDPSTNSSYKIWITTISDKYELWATLEEWEERSSLTIWTWNPRTSSITTWVWDINVWEKVFTFTWWTYSINTWLRINDVVKFALNWSYIIKDISSNKIMVNTNVLPWESWNSIQLILNETRHLIKTWWATDYAIKDSDWSKWTPYEVK